SPKMWYGEYLRNLVNERSAAQARQEESSVIVRGSAPEEPPAPVGAPVRHPAAPRPVSTSVGELGRPGAPVGNWQTLDTPNFRILHADAALAARVARIAELTRTDQALRWSGIPARGSWTP